MSRRTPGRRPLTVTLAVVLVAVGAAVNLALGVLVASYSANPIGSLDVAQTVGMIRAIAVVIIVLAVLEGVMTRLRARGVNGARLAVTLVLVVHDEIAHHAGVTRAESLAAFYGHDDVLRSIEQVIAAGITRGPTTWCCCQTTGRARVRRSCSATGSRSRTSSLAPSTATPP